MLIFFKSYLNFFISPLFYNRHGLVLVISKTVTFKIASKKKKACYSTMQRRGSVPALGGWLCGSIGLRGPTRCPQFLTHLYPQPENCPENCPNGKLWRPNPYRSKCKASSSGEGEARLERSHVGKRHGQEAASWGSVGTPGGRFCHSLCGHRSFDFKFRRKI